MYNNPENSKKTTRKGCKRLKKFLDLSKSNISVMFAKTELGYLIPLCAVYKAFNMNDSQIEGKFR